MIEIRDMSVRDSGSMTRLTLLVSIKGEKGRLQGCRHEQTHGRFGQRASSN